MAEPNKYYAKLIKGMDSNKDSIFEPCRITKFDSSKFTATVYGMRSNQVRENVLVLFPSLFLNSGIISFPVKNSTGILFVGADNENYLFPAQFLPPTREVSNGVNKHNASPNQFDQVMSLEHMEPGEHLIRSLVGSYIIVRNSGEIELSTSKLHRLALNELDGALEITVEKQRIDVGNYTHYNGPFEKTVDGIENPHKNRHHIKVKFSEEVPKWESEEVLTEDELRRILSSDVPGNIVADHNPPPTFELQMSNVFSEADDTPLKSSVDDDELFLDMKVNKEGQTRFHINLSKSGALELISQSATGAETAKIELSEKKVGMALEQGGNQYTMELREEGFHVGTSGTDSAEMLLTTDGDLKVTLSGTQYSFKEVMERLNQLSLLNQLAKL